MAQTKEKKDLYYVHWIIGLSIMCLFRFLPLKLPSVTPVGMEILGIFLGTLYLWSTCDPIASSIVSIVMVGFSNYGPMNGILTSAFGNPVVVQTLFMLLISNTLVENELTTYFGRFFLTRKICSGRPWMLAFFIMLGCMLMGAFISPFTPIFLFWPILYDIFKTVGMKPHEKFPTIMVLLVVMSAMLGFPCPPYMSNPLTQLTNYETLTANMGHPVVIPDGTYMIFGLIHATICMAAILLFCKYVFRPNVEPFKAVTPEFLNGNPLPPMSKGQKVIGISFALFVAVLLLPSFFPNTAAGAYLKANTYGICIVYTAFLCIARINKKNLCEFQNVIKRIPWSTYFLIASALLLADALTNDATGFTPFLNTVLQPIFQHVSPSVFAILIMLCAMVLTNVCNSLVIGILLQPVIATFSIATGMESAHIVAMLTIFVLSCAVVTPAASPFSAMLFGNKEWLKAGDIYKYTPALVLLEFIIVVVISMPLADLLM